MVRKLFVLLILSSYLTSTDAFAQTGNASVGGFTQDSSQALIPGVSVTATNTQTGVVTKVITNETGTYNIPSLLPGTYRLTAELPGFRPKAYDDVQLGTGVSARYNFTLEVGGIAQSVDVQVASESAIRESSASIGQVLPEQK